MTGSNLASRCSVSRTANVTHRWTLALLLGCSVIGTASAAPEDLARLGKDLTCLGADKSGNADGSIPPYSGKWLGVPPHVDFKGTGNHPVDPYPDEKPLFVITAANLAQYSDYLSDGQKALFKLYPATFNMPVYPSHRDFRVPDSVCQATRENASVARLVDDGEGCGRQNRRYAVPGTPQWPGTAEERLDLHPACLDRGIHLRQRLRAQGRQHQLGPRAFAQPGAGTGAGQDR